MNPDAKAVVRYEYNICDLANRFYSIMEYAEALRASDSMVLIRMGLSEISNLAEEAYNQIAFPVVDTYDPDKSYREGTE